MTSRSYGGALNVAVWLALGAVACADHGDPQAEPLLLVGQRPISESDLERIDRSWAGLFYALGDVNGDERLDAEDLSQAQRAAADPGEVACSRAADVDFDNQIGANDFRFIQQIEGYNELHLFSSAHLGCTSFSRVAGRTVGGPGDRLPLLLLGDLVAGEGNTRVEVASGPANLVVLDNSGQNFEVEIRDAAAEGDSIAVEVHTGYPDPQGEDGGSGGEDGWTYVVQVTVRAGAGVPAPGR